MQYTLSQHESVHPSRFESKQCPDARHTALGYGHQKVHDVIEERMTDKWQRHMACGTTHPIGLFAFLPCVSSVEVQK